MLTGTLIAVERGERELTSSLIIMVSKMKYIFQFSSVTQLCLTPCNPMDCSTPGFLSIINSQSLLKLMSIELVMPSNHLILCRPLLLPPLIFPSTRVFSKQSVIPIRWPKYQGFSFSINPSNEYSGLIFFRIDWFDLLAVQETLKSLPQHQLQKHQFFSAQLSYGPTLTSLHAYWKNHGFDYMDHCWQSNVSAF